MKTEMPLTDRDIEELESLGYDRSYFVDYSSGIPRLRNVGGSCVFLDTATGACKVYEHRPVGCRLYPVVADEEGRPHIDPYCPRPPRLDQKQLKALETCLRSILAELGWSVNSRRRAG